MRKLMGNLPLIAGLLLTLSFSLDVPFLRAVKTEQTFGLWVIVLAPLAILLFAVQLVLWWRRSWTRPWRTGGGPSPPANRKESAMGNLELKHVPMTKTAMLIRKPVADVFEAFVNPDITTKFWFTKGSGRLEAGKQVQWDWEMYGISVPVTAKVIEPNRRIIIEWPGYSSPTTVEWIFAPQKDGTTFVSITEAGFTGDGDELVKQVTDSTQGFTLVLAGLKAVLEHDVRLNLVADRFPAGIEEH